MISFKGTHYPNSVILYAVYFYVRFGVSYRDLDEIMAERGHLQLSTSVHSEYLLRPAALAAIFEVFALLAKAMSHQGVWHND